jgi:hypothetical protein
MKGPVEKKLRLTPGSIKVAKYYPGKPVPKSEGFVSVLIHVDGKPLGGDLSPYVLKNEKGQLLENVWQFSKVYACVSAQRTPVSKWKPDTIVWEHPAEEHVRTSKDGVALTDDYWKWREKGMNNAYAIRYPNGFKGRTQCLFAVPEDSKEERLDYIAARKRIYCGEYARLAPNTPHFAKLKAMLDEGINLQLVEVDGPDPNLTYPPYDKISTTNPGLLIDEETIRKLVNDERKPFGHGYVIATLLLGHPEWFE